MPLSALPSELLDHIISYLDWNPNQDLTPQRPSLLCASLACKLLREAAVPSIFRTVTLRLRWANHVLLEPRVILIRKTPYLARYVRAVYIVVQPQQESTNDVGDGEPYQEYALPDESHDWLSPAPLSPLHSVEDHGMSINTDHRRRVNSMLVSRFSANETTLMSSSAEKVIHRIAMEPAQDLISKDKAIAASLAMLCIPATTQSILFECFPWGPHASRQKTFGLQLLLFAIELLQPRLVNLTLLENDKSAGGTIPLLRQQALAKLYEDLTTIIATKVDGDQRMPLRSLSLARSEKVPTHNLRTHNDVDAPRRWIPLNQSLERMELCFITLNLDMTDVILANFTSLKVLNIHDAWINHGDGQKGFEWLIFAIRVRRALPKTNILLDRLSRGLGRESVFLDQIPVNWLVNEAIPIGTTIDVVRENRLCTDFESFQLLWEVEAGERGEQAKKEWDITSDKSSATRAKLVDAAMASRWRGKM